VTGQYPPVRVFVMVPQGVGLRDTANSLIDNLKVGAEEDSGSPTPLLGAQLMAKVTGVGCCPCPCPWFGTANWISMFLKVLVPLIGHERTGTPFAVIVKGALLAWPIILRVNRTAADCVEGRGDIDVVSVTPGPIDPSVGKPLTIVIASGTLVLPLLHVAVKGAKLKLGPLN